MEIQRRRRFTSFALGQRNRCRSFACLMLLALVAMGMPSLAGAQETCQPDGDIDQSGSVTAADALLAFQQALSLVQLSACQLTIANVFPSPAMPDGSITASDALCIFQKALGLPSCLDATVPIDTTAPTFAGIVSLVSTDADRIQLTWSSAVDDVSAASDIAYEMHSSQEQDFSPTAATLGATVVGETSGILEGLRADTLYYVLVVARDEAGNASSERDHESVVTAAVPTEINPDQPFHTAEDLGLAVPVIDADTFTFEKSTGTAAPQVGAVILGPTGDGVNAYFRRVESVTETQNSIIVETSETSITDVVPQGTLNTTLVLGPPDADAALPARSGNRGGRLGQLDLEPSPQATSDMKRVTLDAVGTFGMDVDFSPRFQQNLRWGRGFSLQGEFTVEGLLTLNAFAEITAVAAISDAKEIELFTVSYRRNFLIGKIPCVLNVTLKLSGRVSAEVMAAVTAGAEMTSTSSVAFSFRYDPQMGQWQFDRDTNLGDPVVTTSLDIAGGVTAAIHLIPEVKVAFGPGVGRPGLSLGIFGRGRDAVFMYPIGTATLSLEPVLRGVLTASYIQDADLADFEERDFQLTRFDVLTGVECYTARLDIGHLGFPLYPLGGPSRLCGPPHLSELTKLYSLPAIRNLEALQSPGAGDSVRLIAEVEDGLRNEYDPESAEWVVFALDDNGDGEFPPDQITGDDVTFMPDSPEKRYKAFFTGHGQLGEVARQYSDPVSIEGSDRSLQMMVQTSCSHTRRPNPDPGGDDIITMHWTTTGTAEGPLGATIFTLEQSLYGDYTVQADCGTWTQHPGWSTLQFPEIYTGFTESYRPLCLRTPQDPPETSITATGTFSDDNDPHPHHFNISQIIFDGEYGGHRPHGHLRHDWPEACTAPYPY